MLLPFLQKMSGLSLLILLIACGGENADSSLRIVGGSASARDSAAAEATVALQDSLSQKAFCSGTLIHEQLILTSAHCLAGKKPAEIKVRLRRGELVSASEWKSYKPEQKFGVNFDIAWIRLSAPVSGYKPLEILRDPALAKSNSESLVLGYGQRKSLCETDDDSCRTGIPLEASVKVKEYRNKARWFHLLLIESKPGVGPCLGDSGGPLVVTINRQTFLAGNFVGWDKRLVPENKETICDDGEAIYNFSGAYRKWIEESSGLGLILDETRNPLPSAGGEPLSLSEPLSFQEWCESRDEQDSAWYTVQRLVSLAGDYAFEHGGDIRRVFEDCAYAEINLRSRIKLDHGLTIDAFAPESFGNEARITDLRPLKSLETFNVESLKLIGNAIDDFRLIGSLPKLKRLEIAENAVTATGSLDVGGPFDLERLTLRNSPKAVQLETISKIPNLRYLELENVRTEGNTVIIPANKLLELTVKADIDLELPELMPSLQTIRISGLRSMVMAKRLPKLRTFQMEESKQAQRAGNALSIEEMPQIESFIFRKNSGILQLDIPKAPKLRSMEIVASNLQAIGEISGMVKLMKADFSKNQLMAIPTLSGVPILAQLILSDNPLSDLSALNAVPSLRVLTADNIGKGSFSSLGELRDLPMLEELRVGKNAFRTVKEFLRFPKLQVLVLSDNEIQDITSLSALKELSYLEVVNNPLIAEKCPLVEARYCRFEWARQY